MQRTRNPSRTLLLALLTLLMTVHPLAGSGRACGRSLAHLMKELVCVCEHCGEEQPAAMSCCSEEEPTPAPVPAAGSCAAQCPCAHPSDLPLSQEEPLGSTRDGGADEPGALRRQVDADAEASAATLVPMSLVTGFGDSHPAGLTPGRPAPPGAPGARFAARSGPHGIRTQLERGPIAFLALLCTALI